MLLFCTILLLLGASCCVFKYWQLRKEIRSVTSQLESLRQSGSSAGVRVNSPDKDMAALALALQEQSRDSIARRAEHTRSLEQIRQNMAGISHDLRTPLTSVIGYLELARQQDTTEDQRQAYLEIATQKALGLNALVNSLFELARLEAEAFPLHPEIVDANEILAEELAASYQALSALDESIQVEVSPKPMFLFADRIALRRIFSNLLQNIIRHKGSSIRIASVKEGDRCVFYFENAASGLTQKDAEQLFNRFYISEKDSSSRENSGLGLSIVREFVRQSEGQATAALERQRLTIRLEWKARTP